MTEVPGTDRNEAGENVLRETPLVPESVEDADDDPRSTDRPDNRGDDDAPVAPPPSA